MKNKKWTSLALIAFLASFVITHGDDLQPLGDEFNSAATQDQWLRLYEVEGWNANQLERWDFTPSYAPGHMVMIPYTSSWFADLKGELTYKNISGDFIITTRIRIARRPLGPLPVEGDSPDQFNASIPEGAPTRLFSLTGIFVRSPRAITNAAPNPMPVGDPVWPPGGAYATDWTPNGENYIFLSMGSAGNPGTWQYEVKTTVNSTSRLYYNNHGIPTDNADAQYVTLQLVKIGNTAVSLRKHAAGPWIVENRYTSGAADAFQQLPPFGNDMQAGIVTYTDWQTLLNEGFYINDDDEGSQFHHNYTVITNGQPDLIAMVDYFRLQRPPTGLTEDLLNTLPITYPGAVPALLTGEGAGAYLGDVANRPALSTNTELSFLALQKEVVRAYPFQSGAPLREIAFPKTFGKIVAVNDFNGDGTNDFISVKGNTGRLFVANGTTFVEQNITLPSEKGRRIIGSGDVTGDGKAELFTRRKKSLYIHDFPSLAVTGALTDFRFSTLIADPAASQLLLFKGNRYVQEAIPLGVTNAATGGSLTALPKGYKVVASRVDGSLFAKKNKSLFTLNGPNFSVVQSTNYPTFSGGKVVGPR